MQINGSPGLGIALAMMHLGAAAALGMAPLPWTVRVLVWILIGISLVRSLRLHATRQGADAVTALLLEADQELSLRLKGSSDWQSCQVLSQALHPWVVVLRVRCRPRRGTLSLVICADAVEPSAFRRLRARLRLRREAA